MITNISRITLFVNDQQKAKDFWVKQMGFHVVEEQPMEQGKWLEVAPPDSAVRFVLYEKELMKKQNPQAITAHPSLILSALHLGNTRKILKERNVEIEEIITMPYGSMCTFYDPDGNAYLLREDKN